MPPGPAVRFGGVRFPVEVAATAPERSRGLSGRAELPPGTGMIFVYEQPGIYAFWMIDMQFPLDFVWIGAGCAVVDVTPNVPPPQPGQSPGDLPRYRPTEPVRYVLEINAGDIALAGIQVGDAVVFEEVPAGGC
jgi:uncharacterized protein